MTVVYDFNPGEHIVHIPTGRPGLVDWVYVCREYTIVCCQFGTDGPFQRVYARTLRRMTKEEVDECGFG